MRQRDGREVPARFADELTDRRRADGGQLAPEILGQGVGEALDLLWGATELRPEILALGGDTGRARVEVALAGHVAADGHEHRGAEGEFLRAEERGDEKITPGPQTTVRAEGNTIAQAVSQQRLVDLGQAELPRRTDVLDRRQRRCAGPPSVT